MIRTARYRAIVLRARLSTQTGKMGYLLQDTPGHTDGFGLWSQSGR